MTDPRDDALRLPALPVAVEGIPSDMLPLILRAMRSYGALCWDQALEALEGVQGPFTTIAATRLRTAIEAAEKAEPLFLLHCGAVYSGERDDWDVEANSGAAVDALCDRHPGETLSLYAHPPQRQPPTDETDALRELLRLCRAERDDLAAKLYARKPLTDEQIDAIPFDGFASTRPWSEAECLRHFARAVERKVRGE